MPYCGLVQAAKWPVFYERADIGGFAAAGSVEAGEQIPHLKPRTGWRTFAAVACVLVLLLPSLVSAQTTRDVDVGKLLEGEALEFEFSAFAYATFTLGNVSQNTSALVRIFSLLEVTTTDYSGDMWAIEFQRLPNGHYDIPRYQGPYWKYPLTRNGFPGSTNGRIAHESVRTVGDDIPDGAKLYHLTNTGGWDNLVATWDASIERWI